MSSRPPEAHLAPEIGQQHPTILIRYPGLLIGRGRDAERDEAAEAGLDYVHVGWQQVSAKHCRIVKVDHEWYLEQDASSKNGVYHNDAPLPIGPDRPVKLAPGDRIHLVHEVSTIVRAVRVSYVFQLGQPAATLGPENPQDAGAAPRRLVTEARPEDHRLIDLQCFMCYQLAVNAVRIEPCGHAMCAGCLEGWFMNRREQRVALKCPRGHCAFVPESVVKASDVSERAEAEVALRPDLEPDNRQDQASQKLPGPLDVFHRLQQPRRVVNFDRDVVVEAVRQNGRALAKLRCATIGRWCSRR